MLITVDRSLTGTEDLDLEVLPGVALSRVLAGVAVRRAWCGVTLLSPEHRAGVPPLLPGALLRDGPGGPSTTPACTYLAAIAGPDAGALIPIAGQTEMGSAPGRAAIRDAWADPSHLVATPTAPGVIRVHDSGTVNGTGVWRRTATGWRWAGRRRGATVRTGDLLVVGRTLLAIRDGSPSPSRGSPAHRDGVVAQAMRRVRSSRLPPWTALPDPTSPEEWAGTITVTGPCSLAATRAVILSRGRRPPAPTPCDEAWLRWLPGPLMTDGAVVMAPSIGSGPPSDIAIDAHPGHTDVTTRTLTARCPPLNVMAETAELLARRIASTAVPPWPSDVRWADLPPPPSAPQRELTAVMAGVVCETGTAPWEINLDRQGPHLLIAGAPGTGASTLLATLVSSLCDAVDPAQLGVVLIDLDDSPALAPCARLPHVDQRVGARLPDEALDALDAVAADADARRDALAASGAPDWAAWDGWGTAPRRRLVVVDAFHLLTMVSRRATTVIERLTAAAPFVGIHVVLATHRPAGAVSPALRASCGLAVSLRAASESESLEIIGVPDAAQLDSVPGRALVSARGQRVMVQVALPLADPTPPVRRSGDSPAPPRHLADVIADARSHDDRGGPSLP